MSTSRPYILFTLTILLLSFFSCEALPASHNAPEITRRGSPTTLQDFSVPLSDSSTSLPSPSGTLKAIGVGRGTQNYNCAAASSSTPSPVPVFIGANAILYDASPDILKFSVQKGMRALEQIVEKIVQVNGSDIASVAKRYGITVLGHHYFNSGGQPTFDLTSSGTGFLVAKKIGQIPAPAGACAGQTGQAYGAVDWLALTDAGGSQGLNEVFRVDTSGGKQPPTCNGSVAYPIYVEYAATYWFYH